MKIIAITTKQDYYRIGEDFNHSVWYSNKKVKDIEVKQGDLVEIAFEKEGKENVLTSIKTTGKAQAQPSVTPPEKKEWRSKSPEESEGIRKQAVGKMVAETMKSLDLKDMGTTDVLPVIEALFKKYDELTK